MPTWRDQLIYRRETVKTTWKLKLIVIAACALAALVTRPLWVPAVAHTLVCDPGPGRVQALVLINFDDDYLLFERAATLQRQRPDLRVFVVTTGKSAVKEGFIEVMARISRVQNWEIVATEEVEPISLNAAYHVRDVLLHDHITSIGIVTPGFRSRRSSLIYRRVLGEAGISPSCVPVFGTYTAENWTGTWHGIQDVGLQFLKLQYYRLYVLPFRAGRPAAAAILIPSNGISSSATRH